jgi:hypothetical protein
LHFFVVSFFDKPFPLIWLGFAVLLFSFAFVAAKMIFTIERQLFAIENELETARQIQFSILPANVPELNGLNVAAALLGFSGATGSVFRKQRTIY